MPGTIITTSPNITLLDSRIIGNVCTGKIQISLAPSVWITNDTASPVFNGALNVQGARIRVTNPYGVVIKAYPSGFDISTPMTGIYEFPIPTQAGAYQYGTYTVEVELTDSDSPGTKFVVSKTINICTYNEDQNPCDDRLRLVQNCKLGTLTIFLTEPPLFKGVFSESRTQTVVVNYPTASGHAATTSTFGNFSVTLFEGVYKVVVNVCATYNLSDNIYLSLPYSVTKEKNVKCLLDYTCIWPRIKQLWDKINDDCSEADKQKNASIALSASLLLHTIQLANDAGEDASDYIAQLETLLGCKCTCDCTGSPIINSTPSTNIAIEGCNVSSQVVGLSTIYTINNYSYVITADPLQNAISISSPVLSGCEYKQQVSFSINNVYASIRTLANTNEEADFWASIISKSLRNVDPACLNLSQGQWQDLTFAQKWAAVLTKLCACCATCASTITNETVTNVGADVNLTWLGTAYSYEVYLDGVLVATILTSAWPALTYSHQFVGAADGQIHTWLIVSRCSDKSVGETSTGTFQYLGCPEIPSSLMVEAELTPDNVASGTCPFDLTSLVSLSNPLTAEWHTANNTLAGSLVANPAAVGGGTYYVFNKDGNGCYGLGTRITVDCSEEGSCTAPQNLEVVVFGIYNFFVKFQSAAYPPPSNSYTVKRRLASDPDVGGSYVTIGTPVWNATLNRWVIADTTASPNILYVYRAQSNCASTTPSVDFTYVSSVCPAMILYPTSDSVGYSFTPPGGSAQSMYVRIYDSSGTVLIHTDTFNAAFSTPTTGLFKYLDPSTSYKVRITINYEDGTFTDCNFQTTTTDAAP